MRLRPVIRAVRWLGRTPAGLRTSEKAYHATATVAAQLLMRVPGVVSVYLRGSLAVPGQVRAGYSDIDVVPIVEVPTLDDELRLLDGIERAMRLLNIGGPLFKNIDYVEVRDLDLYRTAGDVWSLDWDRRWRHLAGPDVRPPAGTPGADAEHWRIERLARAVRRWAKASSFILDEGAGREAYLVRLGAERMLGDGLAALVNRDRLTPVSQLLRHADPLIRNAAPLAELVELAKRGDALPQSFSISDLVASGLQAIELAIQEVTSAWQRHPLPRTHEPSRTPLDAIAERFLAGGYQSVVVGERSPSDRLLLVVEREGRSHRQAVGRLASLLLETGTLPENAAPWARRPVLVTQGLLQGAFLFEPRLDDSAAVRVYGAPLPPLPRVPEPTVQRYVRASRLATVVRARCRRLRAHRSAEAALGALVRDVERLDKAAGLSRESPLPMNERELLRAVREHLVLLRESARTPG